MNEERDEAQKRYAYAVSGDPALVSEKEVAALRDEVGVWRGEAEQRLKTLKFEGGRADALQARVAELEALVALALEALRCTDARDAAYAAYDARRMGLHYYQDDPTFECTYDDRTKDWLEVADYVAARDRAGVALDARDAALRSLLAKGGDRDAWRERAMDLGARVAALETWCRKALSCVDEARDDRPESEPDWPSWDDLRSLLAKGGA